MGRFGAGVPTPVWGEEPADWLNRLARERGVAQFASIEFPAPDPLAIQSLSGSILQKNE